VLDDYRDWGKVVIALLAGRLHRRSQHGPCPGDCLCVRLMTDYGKFVRITVTEVIQHVARHVLVVMTDVYRYYRTSAVKCHSGLMEYNADWHGSCSNPACDHTGTEISTVYGMLHACSSSWHATGLVKDDVEC
jgi:hypothetical protein